MSDLMDETMIAYLNLMFRIGKIVGAKKYARPKGEWIDWLGKGNEWECSVCKCSVESHGSIAYNYCPMCGADMKGADDE